MAGQAEATVMSACAIPLRFLPVTSVLASCPGNRWPLSRALHLTTWGWLLLDVPAHGAALWNRELLARRWWPRRLRAIVPSADPELLAMATLAGTRPLFWLGSVVGEV